MRVRAGIAAIVVVVVLTACGGDSDTANTGEGGFGERFRRHRQDDLC